MIYIAVSKIYQMTRLKKLRMNSKLVVDKKFILNHMIFK